jgi:hypothetical protein
MRRFGRTMRLAPALALGVMLGGCESLDFSSITSFLDTKKPLPGERRPVFPEGVPGVAQGVPPELMKGNQENQAALATPEAQPAPAPAAQPKPRPKPRATAAAKPAPQPAAASQPQPAAASPASQPQAASPWPSSQQRQQQPASPWPEPRPAGTFTPQ